MYREPCSRSLYFTTHGHLVSMGRWFHWEKTVKLLTQLLREGPIQTQQNIFGNIPLDLQAKTAVCCPCQTTNTIYDLALHTPVQSTQPLLSFMPSVTNSQNTHPFSLVFGNSFTRIPPSNDLLPDVPTLLHLISVHASSLCFPLLSVPHPAQSFISFPIWLKPYGTTTLRLNIKIPYSTAPTTNLGQSQVTLLISVAMLWGLLQVTHNNTATCLWTVFTHNTSDTKMCVLSHTGNQLSNSPDNNSMSYNSIIFWH